MRKIVIEREGMPAQTIPETEHIARGALADLFYLLTDSLRQVEGGTDPDTLRPIAHLDGSRVQQLIWMKGIVRIRMIEDEIDCTERFLGARYPRGT